MKVLLIAVLMITLTCMSCKKDETTTAEEDWCAECTAKFPDYASQYNFSGQFCGTKKQVDSWVEQRSNDAAGRIPNHLSYINCYKHKAK